MTPTRRVGLVGFGRIGTSLADRLADDPELELAFVCARDETAVGDVDADVLTDPATVPARSVDLVVEAATADVVAEHGETLLSSSDLLVLSTTALADDAVERRLSNASETAGTRLYVPHGAVLGTDGLQDGHGAFETVSITTRKNPENVDFADADVDPDGIDGETTVYDGPTRGICAQYPRNVNSHATVAIAGIGFDRTTSTLLADPAATDATHRIVAEGPGTHLEITRRSSIEGVTGTFTLASIWGTVRRILDESPGLVVV